SAWRATSSSPKSCSSSNISTRRPTERSSANTVRWVFALTRLKKPSSSGSTSPTSKPASDPRPVLGFRQDEGVNTKDAGSSASYRSFRGFSEARRALFDLAFRDVPQEHPNTERTASTSGNSLPSVELRMVDHLGDP